MPCARLTPKENSVQTGVKFSSLHSPSGKNSSAEEAPQREEASHSGYGAR